MKQTIGQLLPSVSQASLLFHGEYDDPQSGQADPTNLNTLHTYKNPTLNWMKSE